MSPIPGPHEWCPLARAWQIRFHYPERFAQEALGHNSKAVHRAYAKRALVKIPSLEDYEKRNEPHAFAIA